MKNSFLTQTFETEIGLLTINWSSEGVEVYLNHTFVPIPAAWKRQTSRTIVRKVIAQHKSRAELLDALKTVLTLSKNIDTKEPSTIGALAQIEELAKYVVAKAEGRDE